jgi:hypothetical protein
MSMCAHTRLHTHRSTYTHIYIYTPSTHAHTPPHINTYRGLLGGRRSWSSRIRCLGRKLISILSECWLMSHPTMNTHTPNWNLCEAGCGTARTINVCMHIFVHKNVDVTFTHTLLCVPECVFVVVVVVPQDQGGRLHVPVERAEQKRAEHEQDGHGRRVAHAYGVYERPVRVVE